MVTPIGEGMEIKGDRVGMDTVIGVKVKLHFTNADRNWGFPGVFASR
jgi:hypothetical protein